VNQTWKRAEGEKDPPPVQNYSKVKTHTQNLKTKNAGDSTGGEREKKKKIGGTHPFEKKKKPQEGEREMIRGNEKKR